MNYKRSILLLAVLIVSGTISALAQGSGRSVMWERVNIERRDLFNGAGGVGMRPNTRRITFIKRETGGNNLKYRIKDASGRIWVAKIADESQPEVAANRILYGLGYVTEIDYLVPRLAIPGKKTYTNVRLEARPPTMDRVGNWKWDDNPFVESDEFYGLRILMAMINNWDLKDSNNVIIQVDNDGDAELRYIISDLGATFGHASTTPLFWRLTRSRNNPSKYAKTKFFEKVKGDRVVLHFGGKNRGLMKDISVVDAQWLSSWLSKLSDQQLRDAFRAANYRPDQINMLTRAVRERSNELLNLRRAEQIGLR